ncbi:MAG TPA: serine/threonine-protein kinase, partial [Gemmatimonadales bacterium]|nr:serine/threonine-protein kinase [Gemmatimonadales bacterium]
MSDIPHRLQTALAERYRFVRELGRGGMATVYLVHDLAHDRPAALKVLHPDLTASLGGDRFLREIELGRTLVHPHIMGMYESGEADGLLYYVMPFVDGESLRDRLDRERQLSIDATVALTRQVAEALAYAHAQGVVHRDIKPENILLERTPAGDRVIVADFGVARAVTVAGGETLTKTGMAVGTVVYMSPEQAAGSRDVTPASDQYSLACVVYEMLTGQPPFTGPTAMSIMARHAMDAVPGLRIVRGAIPEEMEAAVLGALEKVPADRFATVEQFALALTTPGAARPRPRTTTVVLPGRRAPARRRRAALLSLLAVPALAGAWAGWRHWGAPDAELALAGAAARRVAVLYLAHPAADSALGYLADGLSEDLMDELGRVPTLRVISRNGVAPFRGRALAPDSVARALDVGMVVNGAVERAGDRIRVKLALVNGSTGRVLERTEVEQPQGEVLAMRDTLAGRAAELIRKRLGEEIQLRERRASTRSAEAWGLAQQAEAARQRADSAQQRGDSAAVTRAFARADSLLARAQRLDERWTLPLVQRGRLAYERARLTGADPLKEGLIAQGLDYANQALQRDARDPDALELRG